MLESVIKIKCALSLYIDNKHAVWCYVVGVLPCVVTFCLVILWCCVVACVVLVCYVLCVVGSCIVLLCV